MSSPRMMSISESCATVRPEYVTPVEVVVHLSL